MNIPYTFKIFWFENEDTWLDSLKEKLLEQFDDSGVEIEIIPLKTSEDLEKITAETEIDLLLMDYHLGDGATGNDFIVALREKNVLCNIIFYSQDTSFATTLRDTEGVFTTARLNVASEVPKFIHNCEVVIGDVSNMRGKFITGAVDLEEKLNEIISIFLASAKEDFLKEHIIQAEFFNTMAKKKVVTKISDVILKVLSETRDKTESDDERTSFNKDISKLNSTKSVFKAYVSDIIEIRNTLAHSKHYIGENQETIFVNRSNNENYIIDQKWVREKLGYLTKHSINLDRLKGFMNAKYEG